MTRRAAGFTLIEVLIAVAIVGILLAVALPSYSAYVIRARLTDAFAALGGVQLSAEQYWSNNRTYVGFDTIPATGPRPPDRMPPDTTNFTYALSGATASAYTVTATGIGPAAGFKFTIDQSGKRATTVVPTGWTTNDSCWVDRKGGLCTQ
jgi:type IV pilus assembly protein PilE